jgi:putative transposase
MRRSFSEKREIIRIVEQSELSVNRTLDELGIKRSTFYGWYKCYLEDGETGLKPRKPERRTFWNQIPHSERQEVVEIALDKPELSCRELACYITDNKDYNSPHL